VFKTKIKAYIALAISIMLLPASITVFVLSTYGPALGFVGVALLLACGVGIYFTFGYLECASQETNYLEQLSPGGGKFLTDWSLLPRVGKRINQ
jgi:hypothetical protein